MWLMSKLDFGSAGQHGLVPLDLVYAELLVPTNPFMPGVSHVTHVFLIYNSFKNHYRIKHRFTN